MMCVCALWRFRQMNCSQKLQVKKFKGFIWSFLRFSTTSSKGQCLLQFGECFVKFAVVSREDMRLYSTLSLRLLQFLFLSNRSRSSRSYSVDIDTLRVIQATVIYVLTHLHAAGEGIYEQYLMGQSGVTQLQSIHQLYKIFSSETK